MASTSSEVQLPALDNTFGAMLIGCILSTALWGAGSMQMYWYYSNYPRDHQFLKALVALVWSFDTVQQAMIGHIMYYYLNYYQPLSLDYYVWSLNVQTEFEALTSLGVQALFIYRIGRLSKWNIWYTGVTTVLALGKFGLATGKHTPTFVAEGFKYDSITLAKAELHRESEAINGLSAATDVAIAAVFTWLLSRSKTSFIRTNTLINKLISYTINTSALTSLCSVITLILAVSMPHNFVYGAVYFLVAKLYVNSLLATLNSRTPQVSAYQTEIDLKAMKFANNTTTDASTSYTASGFKGAKPGLRIQVTESAISSAGETTTFDIRHKEEEVSPRIFTSYALSEINSSRAMEKSTPSGKSVTEVVKFEDTSRNSQTASIDKLFYLIVSAIYVALIIRPAEWLQLRIRWEGIHNRFNRDSEHSAGLA
ncbi:hypothetical protein A7U60_g3507 [Sanghuangporus baumii]|uniref:DUF6534 domain-containing protein n=1 Tax=Sanghuangporus baumii TaxID=108892 RepID=A0A9Q5I0A3_SANBA|nr:hypothetical protein A7U60_g3507 [Sanghuangporus baumii]